MPFTEGQLAIAGNYALDFFVKNDPIDQINVAHPLYSKLISNKRTWSGGLENHVEQVRFTNDSNYQHYFGAGQVTFNEKDTVRQAKYAWGNYFDGFGFDEDTLRQNGIHITDDTSEGAMPSAAEKVTLTNRLKEAFATLKLGVQEGLDYDFHLDGSQDADAVPGLDHLVSTTPSAGSVGGLSASAAWWQNNANLGIQTATDGNLVDQMEKTWRACLKFGGQAPNFIIAGSDFIDAYRRDAQAINSRWITVPGRGGVSQDASTSGLYFHNVEVVWDPVMDLIDEKALDATPYPWKKRAYFLNTNHIGIAPLTGHWLRRVKPPRVYDRFVHYWGISGSYAMTCNKRNAHAVLSIH